MTHTPQARSILKIALHEAASRGELCDDVDRVLDLLAPAIAEIDSDLAAEHRRASDAATAARSAVEARARDRDHLLRLLQRAEAATVAAAERPGLTPLDDPRSCYVYFLWSAQDELLYVGMSTNVFRRVGVHLDDPDRRAHIHRVTVLRCEDERTMRRLELAAIRERRPRWNITGMVAVTHG